MVRSICVIPTHDLKMLKRWVDKWFCQKGNVMGDDVAVYVVFDGCEEKPYFFDKLPKGSKFFNENDVNNTLRSDAWIIPKKSSSCRHFGYLKAFQEWKKNKEIEMIFTIDHDCFPMIGTTNFSKEHYDILFNSDNVENAWFRTTSHATRGEPYETFERESQCILNHGLWENIPDFDAPQRMVFLRDKDLYNHSSYTWPDTIIPKGKFFAMCGMNLSWKPEWTPTMFFGLQGPSFPFNRFDDIWAGLMVKKIADHFNLSIHTGSPAVWHERVSGLMYSFENETNGIVVNEVLWKRFDDLILPKTSSNISQDEKYAECVSYISESVYGVMAKEGFKYGDYWMNLYYAHQLWLEALYE